MSDKMPDKDVSSNRTGKYIQQTSGYQAFTPKPLPPDPPVIVSPEMQNMLSQAEIGHSEDLTVRFIRCHILICSFLCMYEKKRFFRVRSKAPKVHYKMYWLRRQKFTQLV